MRRIFYLITELDIGGAEKTLYELATRLDRGRFCPVVGCLCGRGPIGQRLANAGIEVIHMDMRSWWDVPAWLRLRSALREQRPHVLHTFLFHANLAGRLMATRLGIQRVISSVRVEEPRRSHLWAERLTRGWVDVVTCVSASVRRYTHNRTRVPLDRLVVIPNAIEPERHDLPVAAPPEAWRLPDGPPVVAVIGRLDTQKDPLLMLRAAALVHANMPEAVFAFAGAGPLAEKCRDLADRLGLNRTARWLNWVQDIRPLLARMDLLALSSRWEGMPNVALEAMACRKPVVATDAGGTREVVADEETGLLVPRGDPAALAGQILRLLGDPDLRDRLGQAGRRRVEQDFTFDKLVAANERLYTG